MKKKLALILASLMLVMGVTACSGDSGSAGTGTESDVAYIQEKGTMIVGMTDFAPMDYRDADGSDWIGFDADMAKAFAAELGVEVEFVELADWDKKSLELDAKSIDVVWNGMTLTDDVKELMGTSEPYCENKQVVVTAAGIAGNYNTVDDIKSLSFAVENGSAGAEALDAEGISYTPVDTQAKALMEVASGSSDACVIDLLMAGAMIGEGTDYEQLAITGVSLTDEQYGVGFRKGSDMVAAFNDFWKKAYDAGTVMETAEKYGIAQNIIAK